MTRSRLSRKGILLAALIVVLAFLVRSLYAVDLSPSMYVKGQPAMRMAARYDEAALSMLKGNGVLFPVRPDPEDTGVLARPPAYPLFLSLVYRVLGHSFFAVQLVQNAINAIATVLVILLGLTLAGENEGLVAGLLMALSPHLGFCSNLLLPDALCPTVLLLGILTLAISPLPGAAWLLGGGLLGASAWLRPNMILLSPLVALALIAWRRLRWPTAIGALLVPIGAAVVILPITLRNYLVFHAFVPISINGGLTLWEGVAESGGQAYGARRGDKLVMEEEAIRYHNPRYAEWWAAPDGIKRDRDRVRRSVEVIKAHPLWYAEMMLRRMGRMLDYWTKPPHEVGGKPDLPPIEGGETPFAERAEDALPPRLSEDVCLLPGKIAGLLRDPIRLFQVLSRYATLPALLVGTLRLARVDRQRVLFLWTVPLYCLLTESLVLLEWRVVASMHALLFVAAGIGFAWLFREIRHRLGPREGAA